MDIINLLEIGGMSSGMILVLVILYKMIQNYRLKSKCHTSNIDIDISNETKAENSV